MSDRREPAAIGRHARLDLVFEPRRGRTVLARSYAEPPLRAGRVADVGGAAWLIMVAAAPGIFSGDRFDQTIRVAKGARVLLTSQSAMQVHPGREARSAELRAEYEVDGGAELGCHWDPIIPFAAAAFDQQVTIRLASGSRLYWSDAMMSGRCGRGESWRFDMFGHELRVVVDGALMYLERYRLGPERCGLARRWITGAADYLGTTLVHHPAIDETTAEAVQQSVAGIDRVHAGVDRIAPSLLVVRVIAARGPGFAAARRAIRDAVLTGVFGSPPSAFRRGW